MTMQLEDLQQYAYDLRQTYAERDAVVDQMKRMYLLIWDERSALESQFAHMKVTLSPDPRNKVKTAVRLMTATEPQVNVPEELQKNIGKDMGDRIERATAIMLRQSDRVRGNPIVTDAVLSGLLYDEIFISVSDTNIMQKAAAGSSKASRRRYERLNQKTPYYFDVHDPTGCYADYDAVGMTAFCRVRKVSRASIINQYGSAGEKAIAGIKQANKLETLSVWEMWTLDTYGVWVEGGKDAIHLEAHDLPCIPVASTVVEGSRHLFSTVAQQREPFLYTVYQSGLWQRANLFLSAMATSAATALWPQLSFISQERKAPDIDMSVPWGVFHLFPNEQLTTWNKNLIDPALAQLWQTTEQLITNSTLYDQVAGAPLGPGASFSETALLNQAGRLPLVGIQRKASWVMGDAFRIAYELARDSGQSINAQDIDDAEQIAAADIPDTLELEVSLDVALPQDRLQMASIVNQLRGIMPTEWLLENIFQVRQPQDLINKAMAEDAYRSMWEAWKQIKVQELMTPPQPPAAAPGGPPALPPGGPGAETMSLPPAGMPGSETMSQPPGPGTLPPELTMMGGQGPRTPAGQEGGGEYELPTV